LKQLQEVFKQNFQQNKTSRSDHVHNDGVSLGIAGDTCPNVLWRLMHGEMPEKFNPKVWWLSLGLNDLARTKVSRVVYQ
jgi:lysophospholipase L1-like esterase